MFQQFLSALLYQMSQFLVKHPDFFEGAEAKRAKALESVKMPAPFKNYLEKVSGKDYMRDVELVLGFVAKPKSVNIGGNAFFTALAEFFAGDFARKLDMLSNDYFLFAKKDQVKVLEQLIKSESAVAQALKSMLSRYTYQQIAGGIQGLCARVADVPVLVVQSPREMSDEMKKDIRAQFRKENSLNFPVFQINRKLIGGLRVFQGGQIQDHSWLSRVLSFSSL